MRSGRILNCLINKPDSKRGQKLEKQNFKRVLTFYKLNISFMELISSTISKRIIELWDQFDANNKNSFDTQGNVIEDIGENIHP